MGSHNFGESKMAKKLQWGAFTLEGLRVDSEDDIYASFPFLTLEGMTMMEIKSLMIPDENQVRGIKHLVSQKLVGLEGSLSLGWDRTSWPIPFVKIEGKNQIFDRRHTLSVARELDRKFNNVKEIPSAKYQRVYPENGGIFNEFLTSSILKIASMYGNVYGPIPEDTKDHNYESTLVSILRDEKDRFDHNIITRDMCRRTLRHMGCYTRYNNNDIVVERIITKVMDSVKDENSVAGQMTINSNRSDLDDFINSSEGWEINDFEDGDTIYNILTIQDNVSFCRTYAMKLIDRVCDLENKANKEGIASKKVKVLIYNDKNSNNAKKIAASRIKFKKELNKSWVVRRDNVLKPLEEVLNPKMIQRKTLSDLNLEIWSMNQIEDEKTPIEMAFDDEE